MNEPSLDRDDLSATNTAEIARAVQLGDATRFEELYARVSPSLYAWASLRAPRGIDPGDLLGETWLHALQSLRNHDVANHDFRAWIFGIAKNVLLHTLRSSARRQVQRTSTGPVVSAGWSALPDSVTSISRRLATDDVVQSFLRYAEDLDGDDRELVVYCAFEGLTCADAATRLGISRDAAAKRWQRLRDELSRSAWVRDLLLV